MIVPVVVTYNRPTALRRTLEQLHAQGFRHLIVVDNASEAETRDLLAQQTERFERLQVVQLPTNTGSSGGFAAGLREFLRSYQSTDYALLHDDDAWPAFSASALARLLTERQVLHGAFPVTNPQGELNVMNIPGAATFLTAPLTVAGIAQLIGRRRPRRLEDFREWLAFDYASFVGYVIRHSALATVGVVSPAYFIYSDDTTYTLVATRRIGPVQNLYDGQLTFIHDCNRATGRSLLNGRFCFQEVRNKLIFFRIASPRYYPILWAFFLVRSVVIAPRRLACVVAGGRAAARASIADYLPTPEPA